MPALNPFHLSLRRKIALVLACYVAAIIGMGGVSYQDLRTVEDKLSFIQQAYGLNNDILEVRRYEKNYLLYGKDDDLRENRRYIDLARGAGKSVLEESGQFKVSPLLRNLEEQLTAYEAVIDSVGAAASKAIRERAVADLRDQGKRLNELSERLVDFEQAQIHEILDLLKTQLALSVAVAALLGVLFPFVMFRKIFRPLGVIKKATEDIAEGRFKTLPVMDTRDEMQRVMEAFNRMVHELERRQDQLVESRKLASIGALTAGVAHQLNNPLNNISTSCQIAMDEFESGEPALLARMLRNIDQETLRARDIVKGLLEFSRVREFSLRPACLAETVERAIRLAQSQAPAGVSITTDIPSDLILPLDVQRIQEVFLNLLINAVQAMDGQGRINVSAGLDPSGREAVVEITDSGPGIPAEIQGRVFDPFFTTKEEGRGTGLGLSIVYGIIQKHAGDVSVSTMEGGGAKFTIRLPLTAGQALTEAKRT